MRFYIVEVTNESKKYDNSLFIIPANAGECTVTTTTIQTKYTDLCWTACIIQADVS